ncbi:MAG: Gfo/Idh/MocA family protein [Myxococcota bacterium]
MIGSRATNTIKILGAGSIGNHLAHAARSLGWRVLLCDVDEAALERTRSQIYPGRYGAWDEAIELHPAACAPAGSCDLIAIGTPPDSHVELALQALDEKPRAILVEKPLCTPAMTGLEELRTRAERMSLPIFVGYDHVVGEAVSFARAKAQALGEVETLDVEFREHWGGIFSAHPWLKGPGDSYLGYWRRGGGASGEHSHAIHLWQHLAHTLAAGRVCEVTATLDYVTSGEAEYDRLCLLDLKTESGLVGRVVQDVVTFPPRKWARIQGRDGFVELSIGASDAVAWGSRNGPAESRSFQKTRPDDFIRELGYIQRVLEGEAPDGWIDLARGIEAMRVVAAAHRSAREGRRIQIDPDASGFPEALPSV